MLLWPRLRRLQLQPGVISLVSVLFIVSSACAAIPHINTCNFCDDCIVGSEPPAEFSRHLLSEYYKPPSQEFLAAAAAATASAHDPVGVAAAVTVQQLLVLHAHEAVSSGSSSSSSMTTMKGSPFIAHDRHSHSVMDDSATARSLLQVEAKVAKSAVSASLGGGGAQRRPRQPSSPPRMPPHPPRPPPAPDPNDDPSLPRHLRVSSYYAANSDLSPKSSLPNCTRCYGCATKLMPMSETTQFLDRNFTNEKGATSGWLFKVPTNKTASGIAVAKAYCVPIAKVKGGRSPTCLPATILRTMKLFLAVQRVSEECGFDDMVPRVWVDKIDGVVPSTGGYQGAGYHVRWYGLFMEYVNGISMENFLHRGSPTRFPPSVIIDMFKNKLNKTQVVRAAMFDLLTSQCDRHAQNIFVKENGNIHLIDNEACLQNSWKNCGFDSVLVPTCQKQEIMRLSNQFVNKLVTAEQAPKNHADPQLLLDYRCWIKEEEIGTNYPAPLKKCLTKMAGMTVEQLQAHYQLPDNHTASVLHWRASDMINKGFEWAFKYGQPANAKPKRYRMQPKCCDLIHQAGRGIYQCGHDWQPVLELPYGDPITGREWIKAHPDTGTYEGGTLF